MASSAEAAAPAAAAPANPALPTDPPSKSSLRKLEKEAALAAKKELKKKIGAGAPPAKGEGKKREKPVAVVVEELPFIEVQAGEKKGESGCIIARSTETRRRREGAATVAEGPRGFFCCGVAFEGAQDRKSVV